MNKPLWWVEGVGIILLTALVGLGVHFWDERYPSTPPAPSISVPKEVEVKPGRNAQIQLGEVVGGPVEWDTHFADCDAFSIPGNSLVVLYPLPGEYKVTARTASGGRIASGVCSVKVTGPAPPVPPVPPGPNPPNPPTPPEPPAPIPEAGLHVLIVLESSDLSKLPPGQVDAINSQAVRAYLNEKCVKVNNQPEYRVWDKDVLADKESKLWQDAFAKTRGKQLPWVIVSNGKTGFEGPLPANTDGLMSLLRKYGG